MLEQHHLMQTGSWYVDDSGSPHAANEVDQSMNDFLLRYLGQLQLTVSEQGIQIIWHVETVSEDAVRRLIDCLFHLPSITPVHLKCYFHGWASERSSSPRSAARRLDDLLSLRGLDIAGSAFKTSRCVSDIPRAAKSISDGYELWHRTSGDFRKADASVLASLLPRVLIFSPSREDGTLVFSHIGTRSTAARVHGFRWASSALNKKSDETLPDNERYDKHVSSTYQAVHLSKKPAYDHVRALIHFDSDRDSIWVPFQRLVSPCTLHNGREAVMSLVIPTQDICVPFGRSPTTPPAA